ALSPSLFCVRTGLLFQPSHLLSLHPSSPSIFFFTAPATTVIYTLSLHDALPILTPWSCLWGLPASATCSHTVTQRPVETCRPCAGPSPTKHTGYTAYCPLPQKPKHNRRA